MPVNDRNDTFIHESGVQEKKENSILNSKGLVYKIEQLFKTNTDIKSIEQYEPNETLRINGAPAVKLPTGELVIAPDLKCELKDGTIFWIEVKDKCQRFFKPDTGADLHQILGFYQIDFCLNQPVLMVFQDSTLTRCSVSNASDTLKEKFRKRWELFNGEPYGNWLRNCLILNDNSKYPMIAKERSRDLEMYIFYFNIYTLGKIDPIKCLNTLKDVKKIEIKAYADQSLLSFEELYTKSICGR